MILKMGGGHIREAARFTITLGANKISNFKGKWLGNDETIVTLSDKIFIESHNAWYFKLKKKLLLC